MTFRAPRTPAPTPWPRTPAISRRAAALSALPVRHRSRLSAGLGMPGPQPCVSPWFCFLHPLYLYIVGRGCGLRTGHGFRAERKPGGVMPIARRGNNCTSVFADKLAALAVRRQALTLSALHAKSCQCSPAERNSPRRPPPAMILLVGMGPSKSPLGRGWAYWAFIPYYNRDVSLYVLQRGVVLFAGRDSSRLLLAL